MFPANLSTPAKPETIPLQHQQCTSIPTTAKSPDETSPMEPLIKTPEGSTKSMTSITEESWVEPVNVQRKKIEDWAGEVESESTEHQVATPRGHAAHQCPDVVHPLDLSPKTKSTSKQRQPDYGTVLQEHQQSATQSRPAKSKVKATTTTPRSPPSIANAENDASRIQELLSKNAKLERQVRKYKEKVNGVKAKAPGITPIPRPDGEAGSRKKGFNLVRAMGLKSRKGEYKIIRATVRKYVDAAMLNTGGHFKDQEAEKLGAIYKLARDQFPYLTRDRFPNDWATSEIVKGYLCYLRKENAKKVQQGEVEVRNDEGGERHEQGSIDVAEDCLDEEQRAGPSRRSRHQSPSIVHAPESSHPTQRPSTSRSKKSKGKKPTYGRDDDGEGSDDDDGDSDDDSEPPVSLGKRRKEIQSDSGPDSDSD
ncbi:hypothetical protein BDN70DRAFT_937846 [Pholiota conissans]|uniref:Uncharacterized protein n=1 Tax=Pholiota conissans TaxID=109636 RepID=A0A9P5YPT4_9AGAR|nr:hypothetical protein BDN70DRAFT_937846 [Pholiota conissans]